MPSQSSSSSSSSANYSILSEDEKTFIKTKLIPIFADAKVLMLINLNIADDIEAKRRKSLREKQAILLEALKDNRDNDIKILLDAAPELALIPFFLSGKQGMHFISEVVKQKNVSLLKWLQEKYQFSQDELVYQLIASNMTFYYVNPADLTQFKQTKQFLMEQGLVFTHGDKPTLIGKTAIPQNHSQLRPPVEFFMEPLFGYISSECTQKEKTEFEKGLNDLIKACKDYNLEEVKRLIEKEFVEPVFPNSEGHYPLSFAIAAGADDIVTYLKMVTQYTEEDLQFLEQQGQEIANTDLLRLAEKLISDTNETLEDSVHLDQMEDPVILPGSGHVIDRESYNGLETDRVARSKLCPKTRKPISSNPFPSAPHIYLRHCRDFFGALQQAIPVLQSANVQLEEKQNIELRALALQRQYILRHSDHLSTDETFRKFQGQLQKLEMQKVELNKIITEAKKNKTLVELQLQLKSKELEDVKAKIEKIELNQATQQSQIQAEQDKLMEELRSAKSNKEKQEIQKMMMEACSSSINLGDEYEKNEEVQQLRITMERLQQDISEAKETVDHRNTVIEKAKAELASTITSETTKIDLLTGYVEMRNNNSKESSEAKLEAAVVVNNISELLTQLDKLLSDIEAIMSDPMTRQKMVDPVVIPKTGRVFDRKNASASDQEDIFESNAHQLLKNYAYLFRIQRRQIQAIQQKENRTHDENLRELQERNQSLRKENDPLSIPGMLGAHADALQTLESRRDNYSKASKRLLKTKFSSALLANRETIIIMQCEKRKEDLSKTFEAQIKSYEDKQAELVRRLAVEKDVKVKQPLNTELMTLCNEYQAVLIEHENKLNEIDQKIQVVQSKIERNKNKITKWRETFQSISEGLNHVKVEIAETNQEQVQQARALASYTQQPVAPTTFFVKEAVVAPPPSVNPEDNCELLKHAFNKCPNPAEVKQDIIKFIERGDLKSLSNWDYSDSGYDTFNRNNGLFILCYAIKYCAADILRDMQNRYGIFTSKEWRVVATTVLGWSPTGSVLPKLGALTSESPSIDEIYALHQNPSFQWAFSTQNLRYRNPLWKKVEFPTISIEPMQAAESSSSTTYYRIKDDKGMSAVNIPGNKSLHFVGSQLLTRANSDLADLLFEIVKICKTQYEETRWTLEQHGITLNDNNEMVVSVPADEAGPSWR